jgi:hypothetical protein
MDESVGQDTLARSWIGEVLYSFLCSFEAVCFASFPAGVVAAAA